MISCAWGEAINFNPRFCYSFVHVFQNTLGSLREIHIKMSQTEVLIQEKRMGMRNNAEA